MPDLNEEIRKLRNEGMSLRRIAAALGVSHVAILKRWRAIQEGNKVVTNGIGKGLPRLTREERSPSLRSNPQTPRFSENSNRGGNHMVTKITPASGMGENVNPPPRPCRGPDTGKKEASQEVCPEDNDLLSAIRCFLLATGIQMYRMESEDYEGYQISDGQQVIRLYVQRLVSK